MATDPQQLINILNLKPHPEGGHYAEIFRASAAEGERSAMTSIYYLLCEGERSTWHRIDATEIWLYHAGAPLVLSLSATSHGPATDHLLTPDLSEGEPQLIVPENHWQSARSTGAYTLVSCTVSPGFQFEGFELAEPGFDILRG